MTSIHPSFKNVTFSSHYKTGATGTKGWLSITVTTVNLPPQKMEHFIASFNALMEHTAHVEQQLHLDQEAADVETAEEFLGRHMQIHDQLKKAPQNTIREGNELLRDLEQVSMTCALRFNYM